MDYREGYRVLITYLDVFELFALKCTCKWINVYITQSIHQKKIDTYIEQQQSMIDQMLFLKKKYVFQDLLHNSITINVSLKRYSKYYTDVQIGDIVIQDGNIHVVKTKEDNVISQRAYIYPRLYFTAVDFNTNKITSIFHPEMYGDGTIRIAQTIDFKLYIGYADIDIVMGPDFIIELYNDTIYQFMDMNTRAKYTSWLSAITEFDPPCIDDMFKDWNINLNDYGNTYDYVNRYPVTSVNIYDFVVETDTIVYFRVKIAK